MVRFDFDTVTLEQIRQIPGVTGVITTLYDTAPGEIWSRERIRAMKNEVAAAGLHISGIESVNVHDAIKTGSDDCDKYIDNYIATLENLGKKIFTSSAIISCPYLTGQEPNLPADAQTALLSLPTHRKQWTR